jgi:hypothetical protein
VLRVRNVEFLPFSLVPLTFLALEAKASGLGSVLLGGIARPGLIDVRLVMDACHGGVLG